MPRYGADHLATLQALGNDFSSDRDLLGTAYLPPEIVLKTAGILTKSIAIGLGLTAIAVILSWFGWISI